MPDLGQARVEGGGRFIYSEIEIGKVSQPEVKWHCFAGRVALQNGQKNARGGSLWKLSGTCSPPGPNPGHMAAISSRKPSMDPGIYFPVI